MGSWFSSNTTPDVPPFPPARDNTFEQYKNTLHAFVKNLKESMSERGISVVFDQTNMFQASGMLLLYRPSGHNFIELSITAATIQASETKIEAMVTDSWKRLVKDEKWKTEDNIIYITVEELTDEASTVL